MADAIQPNLINPLISIQPVVATAPNQALTGSQFLLSALANGALVRGFVVNRDSQNNPILRTEQGDLLVHSDVFIKTGSEVVFRIDPSLATRARILTIDQLTPEAYAELAPQTLTQDTISPSPFKLQGQALPLGALPQTEEVIPFTLPVLQAVVLNVATPTATTPSPNPPSSPPSSLPLTNGALVTLTVRDVELPPLPVTVATVPPAPQLSSLLPAVPAAQSSPPPLQASPLGALPPGTTPAAPQAAPHTALQPSTPEIHTQPLPANLPPSISAALFAAEQPAQAASSGVAFPAAPTPNFPRGQGYYAPPPAPSAGTPPIPTQPPTPAAVLPDQKATTTSVPTIAPPPLQGQTQATSTSTSTASATTPPRSSPATPAAPAAASTTGATTIEATIIGHGEDGSNVVHTSVATLKILSAQPLPTGTKLLVELSAPHAQADSFPAFSHLPTPPSNTAPDLRYLGDALAALQAQAPTAAEALLQQMPVIGPKFTSGLLFFLSAVRGGGLRAPSDPRLAASLEALAPELLPRMAKELATLDQQWADSPLEGWKGMPLPILHGHTMQPAHLYIRDEPQGNEASAERNVHGQRFLFDVHLSELGNMQFDGFIRPSGEKKTLELFLRTAEPLDPSISHEITTRFTDALEAAGMQGQVMFQQGSEHFVRPVMKPFSPPTGDSPHTILA